MRDFDDSTLWRISEYERVRSETGTSGFVRLGSSTVLPTALTAELNHLERGHRALDALDVVSACVRHGKSALVLLRHNDLVWPLTLFPQRDMYHLPRPIIASLEVGNLDLQVIAVEPPGLDADRDAGDSGYRPLAPLLWALALYAPRPHLLEEIGGRTAFRLAANFTPDTIALSGALGPALRRLRTESASLVEIAGWHGMDRERAVRLLNGVYLQGGLMVLRTHPSARETASPIARLRNWFRP